MSPGRSLSLSLRSRPLVAPAGGAGAPEVVDELPEDAHGPGQSFDDEVEAEVAELLGEIEPPAADGVPVDDAEH